MDPQATWDQLLAACRQDLDNLSSEDWDDAVELARSLLTWLDRGGFPPSTGTGDPANAEIQKTVASEFCRALIGRRADRP